MGWRSRETTVVLVVVGGRTYELRPWKEEESERDGGRTEKGEKKEMGREEM